MKTILKIITILLVTSVVAGGFVLAVNKTLGTSISTTGSMTNTNGQFTGQSNFRPEGGGESGASTARGLSGIFFMLIELTGITAIVLLLENLFGMLKNRKPHASQR